MLPHGGHHMASSSAPASDDGAKFTLLGQHSHHYSTPANHHNMGPDFSVGAFQQQQPQQQQHDHVPHHHPLTENHPFLASQARELLEPRPPQRGGGEGFSDFNHGYLFSTNQGFGSHYAGHDRYGTLATKPSMTDGHFLPSFSLEALLDTLSMIQQKVQQLQGTVQVMAQGGGQQTSPHQQHALSAAVTSIISQLVAASASLLQHTAPPSQHAPAIYSHFNRSVSGPTSHVHDIQQDGMSSPLFSALPSFMIGSHEENFHVPGSRNFSDSVANMGHGQGHRGEIADLGTVPNVLTDQKPAVHSTILSASNPDTVVGKTDSSNHPMTGVDSLVATTAINRLAVSNAMNGSAEFDKGVKKSLTVTAGTCSQPGLDRSANIGVPSPDDHDHDSTLKDDDENGEGEFLSPGSYELIEMDAAEILAEHTHFCEICGKGFKRDANLRMHMRGHGDEYKTPAALARPDKTGSNPTVLKPRRYSCPYLGCKRNKKHRKFQPLKTMLCVKNHYKRSHCPKMYSCSKCKVKKFSVVADLKTHEKHCGQDKWQCSCGTTFSRKDKLFGHISLFTGHTPALPLDEVETSVGGSDPPSYSLPPSRSESMPYNESSHLSVAGSNTLEHGNMQLIAGHSQQMDKAGEAANCKALAKSEGLQILSQGDGAMDNSHEELLVVDTSPSTSLSGGMASDTSIFHDLLTSDFYHQANNST